MTCILIRKVNLYTDMDTKTGKKTHVKTQREDGHLQAKQRGLRRNQSCWRNPWPQTSSLQNCENFNVCCLSPPVSGAPLQQPGQTKTHTARQMSARHRRLCLILAVVTRSRSYWLASGRTSIWIQVPLTPMPATHRQAASNWDEEKRQPLASMNFENPFYCE